MRKPKFPSDLPRGVSFPALDPRLAPPVEDAPEPIDFAPVPRLRHRRSGWTEQRQRGFIAALARCGSVSAAARHVGMTPRTAYKLLDAPGADGFAAAWDVAIDQGFARVQADALERALSGSFVPIYRRGKLARVEFRHNDRLAIALLSGRDKGVDDNRRRSAAARRDYRADMGDLDALRAEHDARREAALAELEEEHRAAVARLTEQVVERIRSGTTRAAARTPRIIAL